MAERPSPFDGGRARLAARHLSHAFDIGLVRQVLDVELQLEIAVHVVGRHHAVDPVGVELAVALRRDVAAHGARAIAHRPAAGQGIGRPQAEGVARRVAQGAADAQRLGDRLARFAVHVGVVGVHVPLRRDLAGQVQLPSRAGRRRAGSYRRPAIRGHWSCPPGTARHPAPGADPAIPIWCPARPCGSFPAPGCCSWHPGRRPW